MRRRRPAGGRLPSGGRYVLGLDVRRVERRCCVRPGLKKKLCGGLAYFCHRVLLRLLACIPRVTVTAQKRPASARGPASSTETPRDSRLRSTTNPSAQQVISPRNRPLGTPTSELPLARDKSCLPTVAAGRRQPQPPRFRTHWLNHTSLSHNAPKEANQPRHRHRRRRGGRYISHRHRVRDSRTDGK